MKMDFLFLTAFITIVVNVVSADANNIINYFDSDTFKTIQRHWQIERKAFENALALILQQDYGLGGMNVYVGNVQDTFKISHGFHFSDNVIDLVILETHLQELPTMIAPEIIFALASNYLHVEADLGRMILSANYLLARNQSDVINRASEQDAYKRSPFSFQQVQDSGEMTIIAQDCSVSGYTITTLSGNTIHLGLDTFKLTNCKFSVEIFSPGSSSPPVFGPYFSEKQGKVFETMLSKPISAELMLKLQSAVFTYVNTSTIFEDKLPQLRFRQNAVLKESHNYMSGIIGKFTKNTIKNTQGILELKPLELLWNKTCLDGSCGTYVRLKNLVLYGLDTAYSAHIGGPFKLHTLKLAETIRFSSMQVRGKIYFENTTINGEFDFAVELRDVAVNVEMESNGNSFVSVPSHIDFTGWRSLEYSILDLHSLGYERQASQSFITGYLINELPKRLSDYIKKYFDDPNGKVQNKDETDLDQADEDTVSKSHNKDYKEDLTNQKADLSMYDEGDYPNLHHETPFNETSAVGPAQYIAQNASQESENEIK